MTSPTPIGQRLKELREQAGVTQRDLSIRSGLYQQTISDIETGKSPHPRLSTLRVLETALDRKGALTTQPPSDAPSLADGIELIVGKCKSQGVIPLHRATARSSGTQ